MEDVRELMGASTPHFALQLRNRIARLIAGLPAATPHACKASGRSRACERLGLSGETRGEAGADGERPLPSLSPIG